MKTALRRFTADSSGATAIEYGLIVCLIVVAASTAFPTMAKWVNTIVMTTATAMSGS